MQVPFLSLKEITALHGAEYRTAVNRVVESGWYLQGEENARFEKHYAEFIGMKFCVGCANELEEGIERTIEIMWSKNIL